MNDLSPEAAALLRAGRTSFRPDGADRDRILASLGAVLGETEVSDGARHAGRANVAAGGRFALRSWVVGGLAAVALATGAFLASAHWIRPPSRAVLQPPPPTAAAPAEAVVQDDSSPLGAQSPAEQLPPAARTSSPRAGSRNTTRALADSLPEEVRLLSAAEQQMNGGRAADALKTLAEHERRFPTGALAEERMAARVQALCALGRTPEAESELTRLTSAYPRSQHLEHARAVCGFDARSPR